MSSTGEIKDAVRLAQQYNIQIYRYLINGLVDNSLAVSQLKVEFDEYTRSSMTFFDQLRDAKIPFVRVREEQLNVFQEQVKRNDKLKLEVHKIQRGLWTRREMGQPVPMANKNMIIQGFPELCVSTSPDKVPLTVLCEQIIRKYNTRKERSIAALLRLAKEESISRQTSNTASVGPYPNKPQLLSVRPTQPNLQPAVPVPESHDVTPPTNPSCDESTKELVQPVTLLQAANTKNCVPEKKLEVKQDLKKDNFPFPPRKYPLFSIDELFEMFLKPGNRDHKIKQENHSTATTPEKVPAEMNPEGITEEAAVIKKPACTYTENTNDTTKPTNRNGAMDPTLPLTRQVEQQKKIYNSSPNSMKMVHSALEIEIQKTNMKIQKLQALIDSERRRVKEKKINRVPHTPKSSANNVTPLESLQYQQKMEEQLAVLKNPQYAPAVPPKNKPTAKIVNQLPVRDRPNTLSPSHTSQMSRKRPFSSVDTVSSVPAAKRARQEPCILQEIFHEKSDWDDEQVNARN